MSRLKLSLLLSILFSFYGKLIAQDSIIKIPGEKLIYRFEIKDQIAPPVQRLTSNAITFAHEIKADIIFIEMNTYGGLVDAADSIRTRILNSKIPVYVLIQNNAASAGALIAIACDSIYMQPGSTIGAATVVDQTGQQVPDKYQSYMRKKMRSTAEIRGRNPDIAEAMVDPDIYIPGVIDSGKVITFTTTEAIKYGFCEAQISSMEDVLSRIGISEYRVIEHELTLTEQIISILINPFISGILIMLIIGGIYFELQTPGIGFPLITAITAAILYFAPLYLEGLASNFEIVLFVLGLILLGVEIFVIPGFGVAGILGVALVVAGLTLSLVHNDGFDFTFVDPQKLVRAFLMVSISAVMAVILSIYLGARLLYSSAFNKIILHSSQETSTGYSSASAYSHTLIGREGTALTMLRPSGKVEVEGETHDATALTGFIEKGAAVKVLKYESAQLVVKKI
ncbi:MAG: nodulation protein NfeD [Bacteroidetes bacterium]|nr:nodulation protein NfeD [Bacteroidota bacterium]HET6243400.1 NfeD family protein [Bacteroidia bacterium]